MFELGNPQKVLVLGDGDGRFLQVFSALYPQAQIDADPRLLGLVIEKTDRRTKPPRIYKAVECEAVGQVVLEQMLRDALGQRLPEPLEAVRVREAAEPQRRGAGVLEHRQVRHGPCGPQGRVIDRSDGERH